MMILSISLTVLYACEETHSVTPTESEYQYLFDAGYSSEEVTKLVNRDLFKSLTRDQVNTYLSLNADEPGALSKVLDALMDTVYEDDLRMILWNRYVNESYSDAISDLNNIKDAYTLDVQSTNYAIRADNVSEYLDVRDTYGLGGYFYNYFKLTNIWRHENQFEPAGQIVFIGSSVIEQHNFEAYFPNTMILNRGIGGDYSDGIRERLDVSVFDVNPSKVFLYVGGNDYVQSRTPQEIADKVDQIIQLILNKMDASDVYLMSTYPINESKTASAHTNADIDLQNQLYEALATTYNITFVNVHDVVSDDNGQLVESYTSDGIHMNISAYSLISDVLRPFIEE